MERAQVRPGRPLTHPDHRHLFLNAHHELSGHHIPTHAHERAHDREQPVVPGDRPGRAACRLDGTVTVARLRGAATAAMLSVNRELAAFKLGHIACGHGTLADIPADQVGRSSVLVLHYRRAVYSAVQAELVEEYRDMDTTGKGDKNADAMEPRADTHRRNMRWALSDLLGQPRTTVELI